MERVDSYRQQVQSFLRDFAADAPHTQVVFDTEHDRYLVIHNSWHNDYRTYGCAIHSVDTPLPDEQLYQVHVENRSSALTPSPSPKGRGEPEKTSKSLSLGEGFRVRVNSGFQARRGLYINLAEEPNLEAEEPAPEAGEPNLEIEDLEALETMDGALPELDLSIGLVIGAVSCPGCDDGRNSYKPGRMRNKICRAC